MADKLIGRGFALLPKWYANHTGNSGTGMPLDTAAQIALRQAAAARQTYFSGIKEQRGLTNENYQNNLHDLREQHPYDQASLNDNYGSSGLGFSSGYGNAVHQLAHAYNTNTDRLINAHADTIQQLHLNRQNYMREYRQNIAAIRQAAADRLSASAGLLGLGNTSNPNALSNEIQGHV